MKSLLSYKDFLEAVMNGITVFLPDNYSVSLHQVVKNNNITLDGLRIREGDEKFIPSIYLNDYYSDYRNGRTIELIQDEIWAQYLDAKAKDSFHFDILDVFENASEKVIAKLVNYEKNKYQLEDIPHARIGDLAVTYHLFINEQNNRLASIRLTNENISRTGMDPTQLFETAIRNTAALFPPVIKRMEDILFDILNSKETPDLCMPLAPDMYVLTNEQGLNGALCLLYDGLLDSLSDKLGTDFYILPSSIHELILLPETTDLNIDSLNRMVREVNLTQVPDEDILSDHAYLYSELKTDIMKQSPCHQNGLFVQCTSAAEYFL